MRYASIREMDITNGSGVGVSLFTQGCSHRCKGCFNSETWDFNGGYELTEDIKKQFLENCKTADFVSILGGEPFDQEDELYKLLEEVRHVTSKPIYVWTGYLYEDVAKSKCMKYITYLIDGEFIEEKKDLKLKLRGSSNQRVINIQKTREDRQIWLVEN